MITHYFIKGKNGDRLVSTSNLLASVLVGLVCVVQASAGTLEQAKRIHDRIAGVPPNETVLLQMVESIENSGNGIAAARIAMENDNFYNATLKTWVAPWTNREADPFVPLNDYIATVVGAIRDSDDPGFDFRRILWDDILYVGQGVSPAYSPANNAHYEALEQSGASLKTVLTQVIQSGLVNELPDENSAAGVVTSRAAAKAFFVAGTNRANFRFTLMNHLCVDLEQVHDVTRVPDRIRQDVSRSPGGDSRVYMNNCIGCHAGMDPMTQAFAYYHYQSSEDDVLDDETLPMDQIIYHQEGDLDSVTGTRVQAKYHFNANTFPYGFVTQDDRWDNYWREGINKNLGWASGGGSGNGATSMLQELANSQAFAQCQVRKVFQAVCLREPAEEDLTPLADMVTSFTNGYNMKQVFAEAADHCKGN